MSRDLKAKERIQGGFSFISTVLEVQVGLPVDIAPGIRIQEASDDQAAQIRKWFAEQPEPSFCEDYHEEKYYVIALKSSDITLPEKGILYETHLLDKFLSVSLLAKPFLRSFLTFFTDGEFGEEGMTRTRVRAAEIFYRKIFRKAEKECFNNDDLQRLKDLMKKYTKLTHQKHEAILGAIDIYKRSQEQYYEDELLLPLIFFMVLEMLITHKPNDREIGDSLSHQIKTKMIFLSQRFPELLDYNLFEDYDGKPEKIWSALYEYRSRLAHGDHINFKDKGLKVLSTQEDANLFLREATRKLLLYAINEPDTVIDLKPI